MGEIIKPGWCSGKDIVKDRGITIFELFEYIKIGLPAYTRDHEAIADSDYLVSIKKVLLDYFNAKIKHEHQNYHPKKYEIEALAKYEYKIRFDEIFDHPHGIKLLSFNELLKNTLAEVWTFQFKTSDVDKFFEFVTNENNVLPSYGKIIKEKELQAWGLVSEIMEVRSEEIQKVTADALQNEMFHNRSTNWAGSEESLNVMNEYNHPPGIKTSEPSHTPALQEQPEKKRKPEHKDKKLSHSGDDNKIAIIRAKILEQIDQCQAKKESLSCDTLQSEIFKNRSMILAGSEGQRSETDNTLLSIILDNRSTIADLANTRGSEGEREFQALNLISLLAGAEEVQNTVNEYKQTHCINPMEPSAPLASKEHAVAAENEEKDSKQADINDPMNPKDYIMKRKNEGVKNEIIACELHDNFKHSYKKIAIELNLASDLNKDQNGTIKMRGKRYCDNGRLLLKKSKNK